MNANRRMMRLLLTACFILLMCYSRQGFGQVTPPEEFLGYKPGADFHLATYEQLSGYLELLAGESGRIRVFAMGTTTEGRSMKYAVISSEENMAELEKYREISRKLSLSRGVSEEEAARLAREGKVVVWIDSGIHASETSPPMHQFQLAYDLVAGEDERTRFIRDRVILLLVEANPDGMTLVADWYMQHIGTPFETSSLPVLYNKYAGHDNNRDAFMANLRETRNMNRVVGTEWYPELLYTQHETAPFPARIWLPPNPEPVNPNMHPLIFRWKNLVGSAMAQRFDAEGLPGAISRTAFDLWYPGYTDGPSVEGHNIPSILTETANYRYATPRFYTVNDFPEAYRDLTMGTFYPSPWQGGWWRFRDAVTYNLTASKSLLDVAARYRYEFLFYKYTMARDVIERFKKEPPYGWIIPSSQRDPNTTVLLLNRLIGYGIEVSRADSAFDYEGIAYPGGSYIIPTSQPFGMFVKNILEKQRYPDLRRYGHLWQGISRTLKWDGAPLAPYDGVGWTLPVQMGVDAQEIRTPLKTGMNQVSEAVPPPGILAESGSHYVFSPADNNSFKAVNLILGNGGEVRRAFDDFTLNGGRYPKGTFIVDSGSIRKNILADIASETHITMTGGKAPAASRALKAPRIAVYTSWVANIDAGWISYIFDYYAFPYHQVTDAEIRAGDLHSRFDVIVLPDQSASSIINGHRKGSMPPGYTGGITMDGVDNLKQFVTEGGVLVCNKMSCDLPVRQFNLPVKNVLAGVPADSFNCPGSLIKIDFDTGSPLTYGLQKRGMAYFSRGRAFEIHPDSSAAADKNGSPPPAAAAVYPDEPLLISGWIIGEEKIRGRAAILEAPLGKGSVVLFGFNVHNRAQAYATFKLLFNAVLR